MRLPPVMDRGLWLRLLVCAGLGLLRGVPLLLRVVGARMLRVLWESFSEWVGW